MLFSLQIIISYKGPKVTALPLVLLFFFLCSCGISQKADKKQLQKAIEAKNSIKQDNKEENPVILQGFYWYIKNPINDTLHYSKQPEPESNLWQYIASEKAQEIHNDGFTHIWLPPMGKAFGNKLNNGLIEYNNGYAVYDSYDLGEFHQQGRQRTKWGTKKELTLAIKELHKRNIKVIADIVMNQMLGTETQESVEFSEAYVVKNNQIVDSQEGGTLDTYVNFDFNNAQDKLPRRETYSKFKWTHDHFDGIEHYGTYYLFKNKTPDKVNNFGDMPGPLEYQNLRSDIILGADLDFENPVVQNQMITFTKWLIDEVEVDGFRVDAIRHIHTPFVKRWANEIRSYMSTNTNHNVLIFGENWDGWNERLLAYLKGDPEGTSTNFNESKQDYVGIDKSMSLFDVPLHYDFQKIAGENAEQLDISELPTRGLLAKQPNHTITFVDNHDTVPTEQLSSYIPFHTKIQAYTFILLNNKGIPCIYYRDIYKGNFVSEYTNNHVAFLTSNIKELIKIRRKYAYGTSMYFSEKPGILGHKMEGDSLHKGSGLIYLIRQNGSKASELIIPTGDIVWKLALGKGSYKNDTFSLEKESNFAVWIPTNG